jgi:DNA-binding response OmpR family regulator/DNA-binding CsgD family transcriptional regulator
MDVKEMGRRLILCVEDERDLREDLVEELAAAGYAVLEADDGEQALHMLETVRPDLILCDITMPGMDGYEVLAALRERRPELADIPFVFLTAQAGSGQVVRGKRAGADDYLVKPIDFDLMLATIGARLRQVSRMQQALFGNVTQTLDYLVSGIVLLGPDEHVFFANRAARQLTESPDCTTLCGMFDVSGAHYVRALKRMTAMAAAAYRARQDYVDSVSVPRTGGKRDLLVTVCALSSDEQARPGEPVAVVFVSDTAQRAPAPVDMLNRLFGLTPTEARVAWAFARGDRSDDIARAFGISATTVAFHKRNLFQKTQTNRQADLISLMLTLPLPLSAAAD